MEEGAEQLKKRFKKITVKIGGKIAVIRLFNSGVGDVKGVNMGGFFLTDSEFDKVALDLLELKEIRKSSIKKALKDNAIPLRKIDLLIRAGITYFTR